MAVSEQTPYKEYTANGSTNSFALEFDCDNQDHLIVLIDDTEPSVGTWSLSDGAVVFGTTPINGKKITIQRNTPFRRDGDFQSYDNSFRPASVNKGFDKTWWKIQELGVADWLLGLKIQKFRDDVNLTALENTLEEAKQIRDETADSVTEVQNNVEQSQTLLAGTTAQADLAQGYANSASAANTSAQQAASDVSDAESNVYSALNAQTTNVNTALSNLSTTANKYYSTLVDANADIANIALNQSVTIGEEANSGLWEKKTSGATILTKSPYDPLTQSKNYADTNPFFKPYNLLANSDFNNLPSGGFFIVNANASSMLNMPEQSNGFGFESVDSLGNKTQWYISQPLNNFNFRTKWNGIWKEWRKNADASQIIPITTQKTGAQTLASYEDQGIYNFASSATISDLPSDAQAGVGYTMKVENYLSGDRFKIQYLRCDSAKTGLKWERSLDKQNHTVGSWILTPRLHDGQIIAENLAASFRYKGSFTSVAISDYKSDGLYTFITPTDKPSGASSTSGTVEVKNWFNGSMVLQTWVTWTKPNEVFMRYINSSGIGEWVSQGGSSGSSQFTGKKIVCFGDSITEFGTYPTQLASRLGAIGYNIGFGGTRWGKHENALYNEMCMYKVADYIATDNLTGLMNAAIALRDSVFADDNTAAVTRLQSADLGTVDYVTIFYGTNDFQGLIPIGTDTDATGDTFKGAINLSLDKLLTKYPHLKIVLVTPIWRSRQVNGDGLESDSNPNSLGLYLRDYVKAIKDMGEKYHIPVLDLYNTSGINKYTKTLYLSSDELHPNTVGYTHLANLIAAKLSSTY